MSSGDLCRVRVNEHFGDLVRVDERAWPKVIVRWPAGIRDDEDVARDLAEIRALYTRREAHTLLVDARHARVPTYRQLGMVLEMARSAPPKTGCVAVAVVSPSASIRASVDSIRWLHLTHTQLAYFVSLEPAIEWLEKSLERSTPTSMTRRSEVTSSHHGRRRVRPSVAFQKPYAK
jgi:hypothetical protein